MLGCGHVSHATGDYGEREHRAEIVLGRFIPTAGHVVFAEIMTLPNGMSKGCG